MSEMLRAKRDVDGSPLCPVGGPRHALSAEPGGYYCYQCAEHYGMEPKTGRPWDADSATDTETSQ